MGTWCVYLNSPQLLADSSDSVGTLSFSIPAPSQSGLVAIDHLADGAQGTTTLAPSEVVKASDTWTIKLSTSIHSGVYSLTMTTDIDAAVAAQTPAATAVANQDEALALVGSSATVNVTGATAGTTWKLHEISGTQLPAPSTGTALQAISIEGDSSGSATVSTNFNVTNRDASTPGSWGLASLDSNQSYTPLTATLTATPDPTNPKKVTINASPAPVGKIVTLIWQPSPSPSASAPVTPPPDAPTGLVLGQSASTNSRTLKLSWQAAAQAASYNLIACADSACSSNCSQPVYTTALSASTGVLSEGAYYLCVNAVDAAGHASAYAATSTSTTVDLTPPSVPTSLIPAQAAYTNVTNLGLSWTQSTGSPASYNLKACSDAACSSSCSTPVNIAATSATTLSATSGTLSQGSYYLCVNAVDEVGKD